MTSHVAAIESVLDEFKIDAKVSQVVTGPSVIRYELTVGPGVRIEKIGRLSKQFAYQCAAESVRVQCPIPGKTAVGIELPNAHRSIVSMRDLPPANHPLDVGIGKDVDGNVVTANLGRMPHLLVAGTTGSGKSSFINSMLVSLLEASPEDVRMVLIDPKMVELTPYDGVAHLLRPVVTETAEAVRALQGLVDEMERRYEVMRSRGLRSIEGLGLPYIVTVVDELADLIMQDRENVETSIVRLLQKARAAGIHLVLATQRPSVDVVTGLIKANSPSRLSFATSSAIDSRVILDESGAERLLGMGDGLFKPIGARSAIRIQGAYVSDGEIQKAVRLATATAAVEDMVDTLAPPVGQSQGITALELVNDLIRQTETATGRAEDYLVKLCDKRFSFLGRKGDKVALLTKAPEELGRLADTVEGIGKALTLLRDEAMASRV